MKISVIIPTYNGAHKIMGVLKSLEKQIMLPDEVLVVVDGSTDGTEELVAKTTFGFSSFKVLMQPNGGRAKVRNLGAKEASGDILIFFDDDMVPESNCIEMHFHHHQQFPDSILTGAQIDPKDNSRSDFQIFKNKLSLKWAKSLMSYDQTPIPLSKAYLTAANFSISKKIFEIVNGFDERLIDAEDYDLAVRAQKMGIPLYYNHAAFAWHYDNVTCRSYIQRLRQYTIAHETLIRLKPEIHGAGTKHETVMPVGIKKIAYRFFCSNWWIKTVDNNYWKWLPQKFRYKLFAIIITANGTFFPNAVPLIK